MPNFRTVEIALVGVAVSVLSGCGDFRVAGSRPGVAERPLAAVEQQPCDRGNPRDRTIFVCPGDTLISLSRQADVTATNLAKVNNITDGKILAGTTLVLPNEYVHVVQPGETVLGISRDTGVSSEAIIAANDLSSPDRLVVGDRLAIPREYGQVATRPQPVQPSRPVIQTVPTTSAAAPSASPAPTAPAAAAPSSGSVTIGRGGPVFVNPSPPAPAVAPSVAKPTEPEHPHQPQPRQRPAQPNGSKADVAKAEPSKAEPSKPAPQAPAKPAAPAGAPTFLLPVEGRILSDFGPKSGGLHNDGINIAAPQGTPIRATADGTVAYAGDGLPGFGNLVLIKHADGWTSAYAHAKSIAVKRGDTVRQGQTIGEIGATGSVTEPQLHFELRQHDRAVDPKKMVQ